MKILILFMLLLLAGCDLNGTSKEDIAQLRKEVEKLHEIEQGLANLKSQNDLLATEVKTLKSQVDFNQLMAQMGRDGAYALISLTEKSFSIVNTSLGRFLVSVEDVKPFANGVKLALSIGNPQAMTYSGLKLSFSWTKPSEKNGAPQTKELDIPQLFQPGSWNKVEVVLSPAKADDIDNVSVAIKPNQIRLLMAQ